MLVRVSGLFLVEAQVPSRSIRGLADLFSDFYFLDQRCYKRYRRRWVRFLKHHRLKQIPVIVRADPPLELSVPLHPSALSEAEISNICEMLLTTAERKFFTASR